MCKHSKVRIGRECFTKIKEQTKLLQSKLDCTKDVQINPFISNLINEA